MVIREILVRDSVSGNERCKRNEIPTKDTDEEQRQEESKFRLIELN